MLQVEQGVSPIFNRLQASMTRFVPLKYLGGRPVSSVLHGKVTGTVGTLAPYDACYLGGPYSCR